MSIMNQNSGVVPLAEQREGVKGGNQSPTGNDSEGSIPLLIENEASTNKSIEGQQQTEGQEADPYGARDIIAQEAMADASVAMAVAAFLTLLVTLVGTILIWRQVILTRKAVKDTSKATNAMVRQNELTEAAQRPWLSIEANVAEIEITNESVKLRFEARVSNIGKTVAERCSVRASFIENDTNPDEQRMIEWTRDAATKAAKGDLPEGQAPYPILPQQSFKYDTKKESIGKLHWAEVSAYSDKRLLYTFFVATRYHVPGDDITRETDRAFCLTYIPAKTSRDDPFLPVGIPYPLPKDLSNETVWLRPAGHNRTT